MMIEELIYYLYSSPKTYSWLAILFHFAFLIIFILWFTYKKNAYSLVSFYLFCLSLSVATIAAIKGNMLVTIWFAFISLFMIIELFQRKNRYSWEKPRIVLLNAGVAAFFALWYPHFISDYMLGVINSPLGIIPSPTLMLLLAFFCLAAPKVNLQLFVFTTLAGLFFGIFDVFVLHIYADLILIFISVYAVSQLIRYRKELFG